MAQFQNREFDMYRKPSAPPNRPGSFEMDNTISGMLLFLILCQLVVSGIMLTVLPLKSFAAWMILMIWVVCGTAVQQLILRGLGIGAYLICGRSHAAGNITIGFFVILTYMSLCAETSMIFDGTMSKIVEKQAGKEADAPPPPTPETPADAMRRQMKEQMDAQRAADAQFAEQSRRRAQEFADQAAAREAQAEANQKIRDEQQARLQQQLHDDMERTVTMSPPRLHPLHGAGGAGISAAPGAPMPAPASPTPVPTPAPAAPPGVRNTTDFPELDLPEPDTNDSAQDAAIHDASMKYMNDLKGLLKTYSDSATAFQADGGLDMSTLGTQAAIDQRIKLAFDMKSSYEAFARAVQLASNAVKLNLNNPQISDDAVNVAANTLRKKITEAGYDPVKTHEGTLINRIASLLGKIKHQSGWRASDDGRTVVDKTGKKIDYLDTYIKETRKMAESSSFLKFLQ